MTKWSIDRERESELWAEHLAEPTVETRNALVLLYESWVRVQALKVWKTLPDGPELDFSSIWSDATEGVIDLIDKNSFDPAKGVKFTTYAAIRVRGHMLDKLRDRDWVPRLERSRQKKGTAEPKTMFSVDMRPKRDGDCEVHRFDTADASETAAEASDRKDIWRETLKGCSKVERLIVLLYYHEQLTMKQIGATLGVSESRVSQLHSQLISRLRKQLVAA